MPFFDAPFARGYNSALESVNIPQEQLLAFIDGLNLAMTASTPLRVVNIAGLVIGFLPYHWGQIASAVIQTGAQIGMRVLSKTLTDRYLRAANLRLFKPRGLSVRICITAAMQHLVMHTPITEGPSKLTRFSRGVGSLLLRIPLPITSVLVHAVADAPPKVPAMGPDSYRSKKLLATQRRLAALEGQALSLDFEVPKPVKVQGAMDTMASWGVRFESWREGRRQTKAEKGRLQLAQIESGAASPQPPRGLLGDGLLGGGLFGIGLLGRGFRFLVRWRGGGERDSDQGGRGALGWIPRLGNGQLELRVKDADLFEYWASAKVLWVVIMSSEMDEEIKGIELAESREDGETVDERTWQAEMNVESEELELDEEVERVAAMDQKET
ncbi:hypothetical protein DFH07DRAFT_837188, partial [Mycena maculata]